MADLGLVDTHCHLHDREFFSDQQATAMLERALQQEVRAIICIGTNIADSQAAQEFAEGASKQTATLDSTAPALSRTSAPHSVMTAPQVYWTFGVHPEQATSLAVVQGILASLLDLPSAQGGATSPALAAARKAQPQNLPPVAIGEVGLDYHYDGYDRTAQIRLFEAMLQLAQDHHLPLVFHVREAFDDFFAITANFSHLTGVVHSFTSSKKHLRRVLETTDFYVGVNGLATYSTLPLPPLERILLETDAPFLTPIPFRGIINEPSYVRAVADWLAAQLGQDYQTIKQETTQNARDLFHF